MSNVIQLKNFKGVDLKEGNWKDAYAKMVLGIDVFGLRDLDTFRSTPGVLQCEKRMIAGTEAAGPNDVTDLCQWMAQFSSSGNIWALSAPGASPRLYERASSTWTLRRSTAAGDLTTTNGGGLADFGGSLWTAQDARVSRWDGTTWTQSFGTFTASGTTVRPMKVFGGNLFIGNGRYISKIDSTPAFTAAALTLPSQVTVVALETLGDKLFILCSFLNSYRLYWWDGTSVTYQSYADLKEAVTNTTMIAFNGQLWFIAGSANTPKTQAFIFNGSSFEHILTIPALAVGTQGSVGLLNGGLVFSATDTSTSGNYEGGNGGVWMINRYDLGSPWFAVLFFIPNNSPFNSQPAALYADASSVGRCYVAHFDNVSGYTIWETDTSGATYTTRGIWQTLPIDADDAALNKVWHSIKIDAESVGTSNDIVVDYRLDYATTWTTLKTITASQNAWIPLNRKGRVIEIRFRMGSILNAPADSASISSRIHGFQLYWSLAG